MQIFVSDYNPEKAAQALDDKRVLKMILESSQLLSCALHIHDIPAKNLPCTIGWINHPLAKWAAENRAHFQWLWQHMYYLCLEYNERFKKIHSWAWHVSFYTKLEHRINPIGSLDYFYNVTIFKDLSPIIQAPFIYRCYLIWKWTQQDKNPKWTERGAPDWYGDASFVPSKEWLENAAHNYPDAFDLTTESINDILRRIETKLSRETL